MKMKMNKCACGYQTVKTGNFSRHLRRCTGTPKMKMKKCACGYKTVHTGDFNRHLRRCTVTSEPKVNNVFTCPGKFGKLCPTKYRTNDHSNYQRHIAKCNSHRGVSDNARTPTAVNDDSPENATASLLKKVDEYFVGQNMKRSTCACCNELFAPPTMKSISPSGNWLLRLRNRLKWEHTTHPINKQTKQFYDVSAIEPALEGVPLAKAGVVRSVDCETVKVLSYSRLTNFDSS